MVFIFKMSISFFRAFQVALVEQETLLTPQPKMHFYSGLGCHILKESGHLLYRRHHKGRNHACLICQ